MFVLFKTKYSTFRKQSMFEKQKAFVSIDMYTTKYRTKTPQI